MAKKKKAVSLQRPEIVGQKKWLNDAYTGTDLRELLSQGRVTIWLNTFYKLYKENADLRAWIRKIANKVAVNGFHFEDDNEEIVEIPGLVKAVKKVFSDPDRGLLTFKAWKREALKDYYIGGEIYFLPIVNGVGQLMNFQILDPRTVTKIYNKEGVITSFRQQSWQTYREWTADKIGFYKLENDPANPINGLSLLYSVIWDVLTDNKASQRNYYFFENDKVPRAIMKLNSDYDYNDKDTMAEVQKLKSWLNGTDKSNKTIMSNLVEDVKVLEMSNKDMEFIQQRKLTTDKVATLLGMSKAQLGYNEGINYASAEQFKKDFIEDTIAPVQEEFQDILNDLLDRFAVDFQDKQVVLDTEDINDEYKQHEDERADVTAGILEVNEVRANRWLDPKVTPEPVV